MTDAIDIEARKMQLLTDLGQNPHLAFKIINGFTKACLLQSKSISDIQPVILEALQTDAVKQNPNLVFSIIDGFTRACLYKKIPIQDSKNPRNDIQSVILAALQTDAVKRNSDLTFKIIDGFTQSCLSRGKIISDIQPVILEAIKRNSDLTFKIIFVFTQACISQDKFQELIPVFQNLLEEIQKTEFSAENKTLLINQIKSISIPILSQYLQDTLLTLKDESSLSKKDRDISTKNELLGLFKFLYQEVFKEDIKNFEDIKLKDLIPIWQIYFVSKIKVNEINGGSFFEVLPFIFDIFKDKDLTIGQFIEQTKILLQNFYCIDLDSEEGKDQLKKIKEESEKDKNKDKNKDKPFIVCIIFPEHEVVSIIKNGQISIIDSSHVIFHPTCPQYPQILRECGFEIDGEKEDELYFNTIPYQKNGTCYLNAALAFKGIMEKFLSQQKDKEPKDASTTLNSILDDLKKETDIKLTQSCETIKLQQIVVDVVSQLARFYETLQQPIDERYITDGKVLEKDENATTLTTTTTTTTTTTEPETEFTDIGGTTPPSSKTSEEAANDRAKENLQEKLKLGEITQEILAIKPQIIAAIIYKDVPVVDTTSKIFR